MELRRLGRLSVPRASSCGCEVTVEVDVVWSWIVSVKVFGGCLLEVAVELVVGRSTAVSFGV